MEETEGKMGNKKPSPFIWLVGRNETTAIDPALRAATTPP